MSSGEENTQTTISGQVEEVPDRPVKKRVAKKRAAKKTASPAASKDGASSAKPAREEVKSAPEPVFSSDRDDVEAFSPQKSSEPEAKESSNAGDGQDAPSGQNWHNSHQGERGPKNQNKFKNNKRKSKGKNRWQNNNNRKRKIREEDTPIEIGELPSFEELQTIDSINELAGKLTEEGSGKL
ncbi:MAG: hypothetical protein AAF546_10335, partial [Verrucomicrobiota bacterium]